MRSPDIPTQARWLRYVIALSAAVLVSAMFLLPGSGLAPMWRANIQNLEILTAAHDQNDRSLQAISDADQLTACQRLMITATQAKLNPQLAAQSTRQAADCNRGDLTIQILGEVAWRVGEFAQARDTWGRLRPEQLVSWSDSELTAGDRTKGEFILQIVLDVPGHVLSASIRTRLNTTLARLYRSRGELATAATFYQAALEASETPPQDLHYELGTVLYQLGDYQDSLRVLEAGLQYKPPVFISQLDFAHFERLTQVCVALGDGTCAADYLAATVDALRMETENVHRSDRPSDQQLIKDLEGRLATLNEQVMQMQIKDGGRSIDRP